MQPTRARGLTDIAYDLAGFGVVVLLWFLLYSAAVFSPTLLASPLEAGERLVAQLVEGDVGSDLAATLLRTAAGLGLAILVGTPTGLVLGAVPLLDRVFGAVVDFFRSLPVTTLYPLFILFFGIGTANQVAMAFAASFFVIVLNSAYGVKHAGRTRDEMARLYGASRFQRFVHVTFFDALPQTVVGWRVALSYALIVSIVVEMFMGTQLGIGQRVFDAYNTYAIPDLYALVVLVGVVGYALNVAFVFAEQRAIHWAGR